MTKTTSIMIQSSLHDKTDKRQLSIRKLKEEFNASVIEDPVGFLARFGEKNISETVEQSEADKIVKKNHAQSLTFNNWLRWWLKKKPIPIKEKRYRIIRRQKRK